MKPSTALVTGGGAWSVKRFLQQNRSFLAMLKVIWTCLGSIVQSVELLQKIETRSENIFI